MAASGIAGAVVFGRDDFFLGGKEPIRRECLLEVSGYAAVKLELRVAPARFAVAVPDVFVANVHSADKRERAVDDLELAMIAQVHEAQVLVVRPRVEPRKPAARRDERIEERSRRAPAAHLIAEQPHLDSAPGGFNEKIEKAPALRIVLPDEELDVNVMPRFANRLLEGGIELRGIDEQTHGARGGRRHLIDRCE